MFFLVVDAGKNKGSFANQFKLFDSSDEALIWATSKGFVDEFHIGISEKVGIGTNYMCGDVNVTIIPIQIEAKEICKELNKIETKRAEEFLLEQDEISGCHGQIDFKYVPTGVGVSITARHSKTKAEKDISDYDSW